MSTFFEVMTVSGADEYAELREKHRAAMLALIPEHVERTRWPRERILHEQQAGLRRLLTVAMNGSAWYRKRLAGIDPATFRVADLAALPIATKADFDEHLDDILTDRRLSREKIETHLASLTDKDAYLPGTTSHAAVTGGSSGLRGVFAFDWDAWIVWYLGLFRYTFRDQQAMSIRHADGGPPLVVGIGGPSPAYGPVAIRMTFAGPEFRGIGIPILQPMPTTVAALNEARPDILFTYPSVLRELAYERQRGRLRAEPRVLFSTAEPLMPDAETAIRAAWPSSVLLNWYAATEAGAMAVSCGQGPGLHISEDYLILECVDEQDRPVPPGVRSHRVLLTNLANLTTPTIRYVLSDQVTLLPDDPPCPCGSQHRRVAAIDGRVEDSFRYSDEVFVHFTAFYAVLAADPGVLEFQVHQTPTGARVSCRGPDPDVAALQHGIVTACRQAGLASPEITIQVVEESLPRVGTTGKLKRFFPLPRSG